MSVHFYGIFFYPFQIDTVIYSLSLYNSCHYLKHKKHVVKGNDFIYNTRGSNRSKEIILTRLSK